jgi:sporulation protein YlmC with PRC-barrel domain
MEQQIPGQGANSEDARTGSSGLVSVWRDRRAVRQIVAGELLSLASLLARPVVDPSGTRVGRVSDIVVRWERATPHPPVTGVVVRVGKGFATLAAGEVILTQSLVRLKSPRVRAELPTRQRGEVALARDVLDRQLVDVTGAQVVRAADVYLAKTASGWELAGVDVGLWALLRRALPKRRTCAPPDRALDWTDLQAFVARFPDEAPPEATGPAGAASLSGSSMQTAVPATDLHKLRAKDVATLLGGLDRDGQAQLTGLADSSTVAQALGDLEPAQLDALLADLDEADRAKLEGQLPGGSR